jgi:hypothetical protein
MGFRLGTRVGKKSFVSIGKSGTYFSTWIGGYRLSKFSPKKRKTKKNDSEPVYNDSEPTTTRETIAFVLHTLMVIGLTWMVFLLFMNTGVFWASLAIVLVIHTIFSIVLWSWAKSELIKTMWAIPFIALIFPLGWIWWAIVIIGWFVI